MHKITIEESGLAEAIHKPTNAKTLRAIASVSKSLVTDKIYGRYLSRFIDEYKKEKSITRVKLAKELSIADSTLNSYTSGQRAIPDDVLDTIMQLNAKHKMPTRKEVEEFILSGYLQDESDNSDLIAENLLNAKTSADIKETLAWQEVQELGFEAQQDKAQQLYYSESVLAKLEEMPPEEVYLLAKYYNEYIQVRDSDLKFLLYLGLANEKERTNIKTFLEIAHVEASKMIENHKIINLYMTMAENIAYDDIAEEMEAIELQKGGSAQEKPKRIKDEIISSLKLRTESNDNPLESGTKTLALFRQPYIDYTRLHNLLLARTAINAGDWQILALRYLYHGTSNISIDSILFNMIIEREDAEREAESN